MNTTEIACFRRRSAAAAGCQTQRKRAASAPAHSAKQQLNMLTWKKDGLASALCAGGAQAF